MKIILGPDTVCYIARYGDFEIRHTLEAFGMSDSRVGSLKHESWLGYGEYWKTERARKLVKIICDPNNNLDIMPY